LLIFVFIKLQIKMKKTMVFPGIILAVIFVIVLAFRPANASVSSNYHDNPALPDSVMKIVQKACLDCHGADGNGMAKAHVNFATWTSYDAKKQASKAEDMFKKVSKGDMPPGKWRKNNPEIIPTLADIEVLKNWSNALNK
jgi:mono/diheme cytochrome c family protein